MFSVIVFQIREGTSGGGHLDRGKLANDRPWNNFVQTKKCLVNFRKDVKHTYNKSKKYIIFKNRSEQL